MVLYIIYNKDELPVHARGMSTSAFILQEEFLLIIYSDSDFRSDSDSILLLMKYIIMHEIKHD